MLPPPCGKRNFSANNCDMDKNKKAEKLDQLRKKLKALREERDRVILEKGLAGRDNNDLRENFAYDYWEEKERVATTRILNIIKEIEELAKTK